MRTFGPSKTALHFRRSKKNAGEEAEDPQKYRLEEGDGTTHAQRIVRELYQRYERQLQRWKDYRNLFIFLCFVALFLGVLYEQRNAGISYQVHSTIESVAAPSDNIMQDTDAVYSWLNGLLTEVWKDPVCGDGLCEAPFEFASYSRFGCRADCGKLSEVQNLTKIQIDIYYDFSHPVGSIPASDLMQQASWNLCPLATAYSSDCYFDADKEFDRLSGVQNFVLDDAPDGDWNLVVRRDIFNKIRGAVRDTTLVYASAFYYKIYVAAAAARAEQAFEISLLNQAINITSQDFWTYANSVIMAGYPNATEYDAAVGWVKNATCFCDSVANDTVASGTPFTPEALMLYLNQSVSATDPNAPFSYTLTQYKNDPYYCASGPFDPREWRGRNVTVNSTAVNATANSTASSGNVTWTKELVTINMANQTALRDWCVGGLNLSIAWRTNMTNTVQRLLIDRRLGDQRTTGKIAQRNNVNDRMLAFIRANRPELVAPVFNAPRGTVALQDPINARLEYLYPLYVDGVKYSTEPQRAALNMTRRIVYNTTVHLLSLRPRAAARIAEVQEQIADVRAIALPTPITSYQNYTFPNATVGDVYDAFINAGATSFSVPAPTNSSLGAFQVSYNLVEWLGNTTAYMRCDLADRGAEYEGECVAMNNTCIATTNDTVPYNCTDLTNNGATITGNLSNPDYRMRCETPCDRRFDCNTICECYGTCAATEYCECDACIQLNVNAAADTQFVDIRSIVQDQAAASASIASIGLSGTVNRRASRRLLTTNEEIAAQLSNVLTQVGTVSTQQGSIATQMATLKAQVDRANQLAEARANDNRLIDLINAGRADIQAGQARVEAKLDEIIGKQNQALAAAEDAAKALSAIQGLAERQVAAQRALETAVTNQLSAIKTATYQSIITLTQALALWKRARRDKALTLKAAKLANVPCTSDPVSTNTFTLDNGNIVDTTTSRERNVGLTNRVIGGLLLHQTRTNETLCPESKFDKIQKTCTGPQTVASFGVDPIFKRGTTLYNPDYDDVNGTKVLDFYNCSVLSSPTYNVSFLNQTVNPAPYCAELYNPQELPYAFHFFPLSGKDDGFPVWFDINLSQDGAQTWFTYLQEGLYLDQNTRTMTAEMVTYNAPLRIFSYFYIKFYFSDGGSIKVTYRLNTARVELQNSYEDDVRFGFEIILSIWISLLLLINFWDIGNCQKTKGNFLKYFLSGWNWVEFCSNGLLFSCMVMWWVISSKYASKFEIPIRRDVYAGLSAEANFLALQSNGAWLNEANNDFEELKQLVDMFNWYFALNGINILLLIARVLKLMDFQPRLGVVTRSLWLAGPDLCHFAIVAGMVFVGYAMMGHLIFGNAIPAFATFGDAINTCFEILLGNIDVNSDLRALGGLQSVAGALWFWSYELLVYMVLLNFLLAIIVDAFSEVKEKTHETVGIHTELFQLMRDKWRSLLGSFSPNYISDAKLGDLLRQWAGEGDDKDDSPEVREEKRKLLTILNEDMDEETLREVFEECLRDAPAADPKAKQGNVLARLFKRNVGAGDTDATKKEIEQAAHYIVERFGAVPDDYDEDEDDDQEQLQAAPQQAIMGGGGMPAAPGAREAVLEKERDQLAQALERLAEVQRELAEGQRNLMSGQKQLAEQQSKLVQLMNETPPQ
ncbi:hypothetical protein CHLRE_17g715300v5 [Chlamydomonas reinhardtii]|uniref:Polycystin cation channel PKD1/PKD2 domain-containing protein n=1 Tax=Chlamydomonas reinhardtii TaxID=3055 RepID=A0A2K3CPX6_CHLRE|nr:uncharacterized protein CHLRE_17g715300v5 [Chlamydomonas reinhardtii]PNW70325.1 hypothetical protein CHLRE_17g715300v5 [Chlamydomonas reinhardtii]